MHGFMEGVMEGLKTVCKEGFSGFLEASKEGCIVAMLHEWVG